MNKVENNKIDDGETAVGNRVQWDDKSEEDNANAK